MFSRNMLLQMAASALVFYLVFRLLSFLGLGIVLLVLAGVGVWYLVTKRPDLLEQWKGKARSVLPKGKAGREVTPPAPQGPQDRPLTHEERKVFNDLMRGYHHEGPEEYVRRDR